MNVTTVPISPQRLNVPRAAAFENPGPRSFAERKALLDTSPKPMSIPMIVEGDSVLRGVTRPPPGDVSRPRKQASGVNLRKQRSAYFEDAFSAKETDPVRERIRCESIVMAEVRTNVIISDEFTFITELSYHLSSRFQRPVSSIVVNLQHGLCIFFGGTFEPAYLMSIFALSSQLQPTTNKRNSALISKHMEESLGVAPPRGLLRFVPLQEENVAYNGKTVAWEIEALERASTGHEEASSAVPPTRTRSRNRLSMRSLASLRATPIPELTPPASAEGNKPSAPGLPTISQSPTGDKSSSIKAPKRRYGFVSSIFGRTSSRNENVPPPSQD